MSSDFASSYLGRLRAKIGHDLVHIPGVRVVVENEKNEILFHLRPDFKVWGLPGGGPETGQNVFDQVTREAQEETGLTILNPKPFGYASEPASETMYYPNGDVCHYHDLMFYTTEFTGELIESNEESLAVSWCPVDSIPEVLPNVTLTIEAYLRFKATGEFQFI